MTSQTTLISIIIPFTLAITSIISNNAYQNEFEPKNIRTLLADDENHETTKNTFQPDDKAIKNYILASYNKISRLSLNYDSWNYQAPEIRKAAVGTALIDSINLNDIKWTNILLNFKCSSNTIDIESSYNLHYATPLMAASASENIDNDPNLTLLKYLLHEKNANINGPNDKKYGSVNPLLVASLNGRLNILKYLIQQKPNIDINYRNANGKNALDYAILKQHYQCAKLLIDNGCETDDETKQLIESKLKST